MGLPFPFSFWHLSSRKKKIIIIRDSNPEANSEILLHANLASDQKFKFLFSHLSSDKLAISTTQMIWKSLIIINNGRQIYKDRSTSIGPWGWCNFDFPNKF